MTTMHPNQQETVINSHKSLAIINQITLPDRADLTSPELINLWDVWHAARSRRNDIPTRSDIDIIELKTCLPFLCLSEPLNGGEDFRYRVYGTFVAEAYGHDMTGRCCSELNSPGREFIIGLYQQVLQRQAPIYCRTEAMHYLEVSYWDRLVCPLLCDEWNGASPREMILTCALPVYGKGHHRRYL